MAFAFQGGALQGGEGVFQFTAAGMRLDLEQLKANVGEVTKLDLGAGGNTVQLNLSDLLAQPLKVDGQTGAVVELFTQGEAVTSTLTEVDGQNYQAYDLNKDGQLDLLVHQAVLVNQH